MSGRTELAPGDRAEILEMLAGAAWALDERRVEDFNSHFTSKAVIERRHRHLAPLRWQSDREGFAGFIAAHHRAAAEDSQTWTSDALMCEVNDHVEVVSTSLHVASAASGLANVLLGDEEVRDQVVRSPDGWRIRRREITALGATSDQSSASAHQSTLLSPQSAQAGPSSAQDRMEIEALFADYAWALDTADVEAVLTLFSDDAVMQDPFGRFVGLGPDGIRRFFEGLFERPEFAGRIHWVSQLVLTPIAEGYRADSYALVPASFPTGAVNLHLMAFYRDIVVRQGERWLFRERLVGPRWDRLED